jgi:hypothetical protein
MIHYFNQQKKVQLIRKAFGVPSILLEDNSITLVILVNY